MGRRLRTILLIIVLLLIPALTWGCGSSSGFEEDPADGSGTPPAITQGSVTFTPSPQPTSTRPPATATMEPSATPVPATNTPPVLPTETPQATSATPILGYQIVRVYPHDRTAFTQGLVHLDGIFYEGTGLRGQSTLRKVDPVTGQALKILSLPAELFGEGITIFGDKLYQLTWHAQTGFVYDKESFGLLQTFAYPTEGWGLTHDGSRLIMSDGTATLHFLDPETLEELDRVEVHDDMGPVVGLNELEYVEGEVWANVWLTDRIARINPKTGQVTAWIDLAGLLSPEDLDPPVDVLNGIAYDQETGRLYVTGKLWPKLFEIEILPQAGSASDP